MPDEITSVVTELAENASGSAVTSSNVSSVPGVTVQSIAESTAQAGEAADISVETEVSEQTNHPITVIEGTSVAQTDIAGLGVHGSDITEPDMTESAVNAVTNVASEVTNPADKAIESAVTADVTGSDGQRQETTEITFISEETVVTTQAEETTMTAAVVEQPAFDINDYMPYIKIGGVVILCIIGLLLMKSVFSRNSGNSGSIKSAKQRDSERLKEEKRIENSRKAKKNEKQTKKKAVSKTVKDTLPYKKCLENDIWLIADKTYSKAYVINDINYSLGDYEGQESVVEAYCKFINTLDETIVCQVSVGNRRIDVEEYEKELFIPDRNDSFDGLRKEYNDRVLRANLTKGNNAIRKQIIVTMTILCPDLETAKRKFNSIDLTIKNSFDQIGKSTRLRPLSNAERVELLKDFFNSAEYKMPEFTEEDYAKDLEKTYLAPPDFEFKPDYFLFGDYYAKCIYIKDYPNVTSDNLLNNLIQTNLDITVTTTIFAHDTAKARKLIQRQIGAITGDMGAREAKAAKQGFFSQQMPVKIKGMLDSYKELFEMVSDRDEKLFITNTIIMVKASDYDELTTNVEIINSVLKRDGFTSSDMRFQQQDGMCDCLPVGSTRKFQWSRNLPTESIGVFVPFNVKEIRQLQSIYYGLNKMSNNMITLNRVDMLQNPAGFILGAPGGGKSFAGKREMSEAYLRYPEAEIIVIDPEREYPAVSNMFKGQSIKIATSSKNYINPFDFDLNLLINDEDDEEYDVIKEKSGFITSFIACMYTDRALTPQEVSFIDKCVRSTYIKSRYLETLDPNDMPILEDLFNSMKEEEENVDPVMKRDMLATLEMYVGEGSANYFNHRTNVDIYNRFVSFDIKDLSGVLKTQAMLLVLDNIWNRLSANRNKHIPTWIYCDEIHVLFSNEYSLKFFQSLYKRARKYGGILTGITQNISDLLKNDDCRTMLANSEYLYLLKQAPTDALQLQEILHLTDNELFFVENVGPGEGLMYLGTGDRIPFYDKFPRDTQMYKAMTTAFNETSAVIKEKVS